MNVLKLGKGLLLLIFLQGSSLGLFAQSSVNSSGGDAVSSAGKVSFSIGQVFYTTLTGDTYTESQGVQQAAEIFWSVGLAEDLLNFQASTYPNPTLRDVILYIPETQGKDLSYVILDMTGRMLDTGSIQSTETSISFTQFPQGMYFLRISLEGHPAKTFNIIKK